MNSKMSDLASHVIDNLEGKTLEDLDRAIVTTALTRAGGNQSAAARMVGLTRYAFRYRIMKYGLTPAKEEAAA